MRGAAIVATLDILVIFLLCSKRGQQAAPDPPDREPRSRVEADRVITRGLHEAPEVDARSATAAPDRLVVATLSQVDVVAAPGPVTGAPVVLQIDAAESLLRALDGREVQEVRLRRAPASLEPATFPSRRERP